MSQKPAENNVSDMKREISDENGNLKSNLEVENPNKDDEYVNLSFVKSVKKEGEQAEQNIQQAAKDTQAEVENKHQEVHQEVLEIKAEAVHKVEEVQAEASGNINRLKADAGANVDQVKGKVSEVKSSIESDISKTKDHIEEELSERKAVLAQETGKIEEEIKDNKNQFSSKVGAVAGSANILKTAAADTARGSKLSYRTISPYWAPYFSRYTYSFQGSCSLSNPKTFVFIQLFDDLKERISLKKISYFFSFIIARKYYLMSFERILRGVFRSSHRRCSVKKDVL